MKVLGLTISALLAMPATGAELSSEYTRLDHEADCRVIRQAPAGEGDWSDRLCPGFGDTGYLIQSGDGRETIAYGEATKSGMPSFGAFNYASGTVEWRIETARGKQRPVAAIQRWHLADMDGRWTTQILVVSKVGQPGGGGSCVIGYVSANEGATANLRARQLSNIAGAFRCGQDKPAVEDSISRHVPLS